MGGKEKERRERGRRKEEEGKGGEGKEEEKRGDVEGPGMWSAPGPALALGGPGHITHTYQPCMSII